MEFLWKIKICKIWKVWIISCLSKKFKMAEKLEDYEKCDMIFKWKWQTVFFKWLLILNLIWWFNTGLFFNTFLTSFDLILYWIDRNSVICFFKFSWEQTRKVHISRHLNLVKSAEYKINQREKERILKSLFRNRERCMRRKSTYSWVILTLIETSKILIWNLNYTRIA